MRFPFFAVAAAVLGLSAGAAPGQDGPTLPAPADPTPPSSFGNASPSPRLPPADPGPPARVREGGIDARRFQPDPTERDDRDRADDRRVQPDRPANGYQYTPDARGALPPADPYGRSELKLAPGAGGLPGDYYDPDRSPVLLGVRGTDTAEGVLITQVVPGTPADLAGLERGDRVLTVGGYQVGVVATPTGPRVYPLGRELARRIGPTGEVTMLVQDHRSGRITNITARPQPRLGPTSPYGNQYGPGSQYGPATQYGPGTGFGTGVDPLGRRGGFRLELGTPDRGVQYRGSVPRR